MNHETVLELYEIAQEWSYEKYSKKETGYTREYWAAYKLAELIVAECAGIVQTYMSRWPEDAELTKQIKKHFGVEE